MYALKTVKRADPNGTPRPKVKCRGFALKGEAEELITFERMKANVDRLIARQEADVCPVEYFDIRTDYKHRVYSTTQLKSFSAVFDKRRIQPDYSTLPLGARS